MLLITLLQCIYTSTSEQHAFEVSATAKIRNILQAIADGQPMFIQSSQANKKGSKVYTLDPRTFPTNHIATLLCITEKNDYVIQFTQDTNQTVAIPHDQITVISEQQPVKKQDKMPQRALHVDPARLEKNDSSSQAEY